MTHEIISNFPTDSIYCTFTFQSKKIEITIRGRLSSAMGGGNIDCTIPVEDILGLNQVSKIIDQFDATLGQTERIVKVLEALKEDGVAVNLGASMPSMPSMPPFFSRIFSSS